MANEEAFHLVLAFFIGVFGGLVNLAFLKLVGLVQLIVFQEVGESADLAQELGSIRRILVPTLGRKNKDHNTICDLTGIGVQDTAIARHTFDLAISKNLGTNVK